MVYKTLTITIFVPFISFIFHRAVEYSGLAGATNYELLKFAMTPYGILCFLIIIPFATVIIFIEVTVLILLSYYAHQGERIKLIPAFMQSLTYLPFLFRYGFFGWALYLLFMVPLLNIGFSSTLLPSLQIPNFITGELLKTNSGMLILGSFFVVVALFYFRWLLSLHMIVIEGKQGFIESARKSARMMRKSYWKMFVTLAYGVLLYFVLFVLLLVAFIVIVTIFSLVAEETGLENTTLFGKVLSSISVFALFLASYFSSPLFMHLLTAFYIDRAEPMDAAIRHADWDPTRDFHPKVHRSRLQRFRGRFVIVFVMVITGTLLLDYSVHVTQQRTHPFTIMAHRGYTMKGVENSLEALQGAIDARADYAEIDVQLTKDGQVAVIHDTNLKRLTGRNVAVYDLTMDELRKLELRQGNFKGRIHTLEEFIVYAKGKIKLNIEIKLHGREREDIVGKVVDLIHKHQWLEQCVVQSLDQQVVVKVQEMDPKIKTGYIVFASTGAMSWIHADFIVLEEFMVTQKAITSAKLLGKTLYVWTVNNAEDVEKYYYMGVDGVITDIPQDARSTVRYIEETKNEGEYIFNSTLSSLFS
ncbi:glycerophosphoryl diester phosphodiesterase membrane domain-containing protein [Paenibacillus guangzhouensis]|uniref:glycerophosphoryl diester phosphodiesterase membrane domain-containing protein n=1 Tax=Paenibacillus guangzhouensis TaxID=1473112 RepID=UPI0022392326|nr:glycerophosphodiester phosphodiesterase [Paenibacillus guangzhouensis]